MAAPPAFATVGASIAPPPTPFWSPAIKRPYPTNTPWQNFVLNDAQNPEVVAPYLVRCEANGLSWGYPNRIAEPNFIFQVFIANLMLTTVEGLSRHQVTSFDDLSVTLSFYALSLSSSPTRRPVLSVPLVRGSPYLTFIFREAATPKFSTIHAVIDFSSSTNRLKHRVSFNNGQTWLLYSSAPLLLSPSLTASRPFKGVIRASLLPTDSDDPAAAEKLLDAHSSVYPTGGASVFKSFRIDFVWRGSSWTNRSIDDLLMLSLPVHRKLLTNVATPRVTISVAPSPYAYDPCNAAAPSPLSISSSSPSPSPSTSFSSSPSASYYSDSPSPSPSPRSVSQNPKTLLTYETIDGTAAGTVGAKWRLIAPRFPVTWHSRKGFASATEKAAVAEAVRQDVAALAPISTPSTYYFGKAAARAARMGLIAEELGLEAQVDVVRRFLRAALTPWMDGTFGGNAILYEATWGGLTSRAGAADAGADFGLGYFNDHHFHFGYFVYAAAVLVKFDSLWGAKYKPQLTTLVRDFANRDASDKYFPRLRHFDPFALHSWASGLSEFGDGRNQESTSEAINAYYAVSLLGYVLGDLSLASFGATLAAFETASAQALYHVPVGSSIYDDVFARENRLLGIVWANKRDAGLWFASPNEKEMRVGIQVLPITPYLENIFNESKFAKQVLDWVESRLADPSSTDEWRGFARAIQAIYDKQTAVTKINALRAFDDGNSRSNMLWWVYTR